MAFYGEGLRPVVACNRLMMMMTTYYNSLTGSERLVGLTVASGTIEHGVPVIILSSEVLPGFG